METVNGDELVKSRKLDGKVKSSSSRRRESRVMRRTYRTSKSQRDGAQRRNWTFYEAINGDALKPETAHFFSQKELVFHDI